MVYCADNENVQLRGRLSHYQGMRGLHKRTLEGSVCVVCIREG